MEFYTKTNSARKVISLWKNTPNILSINKEYDDIIPHPIFVTWYVTFLISSTVVHNAYTCTENLLKLN